VLQCSRRAADGESDHIVPTVSMAGEDSLPKPIYQVENENYVFFVLSSLCSISLSMLMRLRHTLIYENALSWCLVLRSGLLTLAP
jgi:hypothetical protein